MSLVDKRFELIAPDDLGAKGRRIRVELFESHDGERCECVGNGGVMVLFEGDTVQLSETISCDGRTTRNFALNVRFIEVLDA